MKQCPTCGKWLTAALVDAVTDPRRDESCPEARAPRVAVRLTPEERLLHEIFFGSLFAEAVAS